MARQVSSVLAPWDPSSHLVLRASMGAWSWGTAWYPTAAAEPAPFPNPQTVLKSNPSSCHSPASVWDTVSAMLLYWGVIPAPLVGRAALSPCFPNAKAWLAG